MKLLHKGNIDTDTPRIAVVGTFDGVHRGHRFLIDFMLSQASNRGLEPSVITFAQHPLSIIRPQDVPQQLASVDERIEMLQKCGTQTCIMLDFDHQLRQLTARQFLEMIGRDYGVRLLIIGFNTRFGCDCVDSFEEYQRLGKEVGVEVIQAPEYGSGICSSAIRRMIKEGAVAGANEALGYRYAITGKVVEGKQLGRTIGFPTANVEVYDEKKLIPATGVYVVDAHMPHLDKTYRAMLNIGRRPTVDVADAPISIEAHVIDFDGNLYGKELRIEFLKFIRPEQAFDSLEALIAQLHHDRKEALE